MGASRHRVVLPGNPQTSKAARRSNLNRDKAHHRLVRPVHKGSSRVSSSRAGNSYLGVPTGEDPLVLSLAVGPGWI